MATRFEQVAAPSPSAVPRSPMFLTLDELYWELRVSRTTALKLIRSGENPAVRIGEARHYRIPRTAVEAWEERQTTAGHEIDKVKSPARQRG